MSKKQKPKAPVRPIQTVVNQPQKSTNTHKVSTEYTPQSAMPWLYLGIIVVATIIAFLPSLKAGFIWDDNAYIVESTLITPFDWAHFKQMWTTPFGGNYHPLTMISLGIERALVGTSPFLYHFNNLVLHIINSLLMFSLLHRLSGNFWAAFVAGLLFGIHPLHVESVTWATERKDVLYVLFIFLAFWQYLNFREHESRKAFWLSVVFFLCSCLSKGMAVVFPVLLVITDYYLLKRPISLKLFLEKLPYFALALLFGIVAIMAQREAGADASKFMKETYSGGERLLFVLFNFGFYWVKMLVPIQLSLIYPYPKPNELTTIYYAIPIVVLLLTGLIYWLGKKDRSIWWAGVFFLVCILPVVQLIPIGTTIVAERYFYLSSVGPLFLVGLAANAVIERGLKTVVLSLVAGLSLFFMVQSYRYNQAWKDNLSIFTHATEQFPTAVMALRNVGAHYLTQKDYDKAIFYYAEAQKHSLVAFDLEKELGLAYYNKKDYSNAITHLDKAYNNAHTLPEVDVWMLGDAYYQLGQFDKALPYVEKAIAQRPQESQLYNFIGMIYMKQGQEAAAVSNYERAMSLNSAYVDPYTNMSFMYITSKKFPEAIKVLERAIKLFPDNVSLMTNMGFSQISVGNGPQGLDYWKKAFNLNQSNVGLAYNIGSEYERQGNLNEAIGWYKQAAKGGSVEATNILKARGIAL